MINTITIKEVHAATGETMRRAGASRTPLVVTDRGTPVAAIVNLALIAPSRPRKRILLPEYEKLVMNAPVEAGFIQESLDEIRGER